MKVYIVIDKSCDNKIILATMEKDIADEILEAFSYENLSICEKELLGSIKDL